MNKKYKLKIIIVLLFFILCTFAFFLFKIRGSVTVYPDEDIVITDNIVFYRQDDTAWAADKLGNSKFNMESSGCLISCIASGLSMCGEEITPGKLNLICCQEKNVFDQEGNLIWDELRVKLGYDVRVFSDVSEKILIECLNEDMFPIVRVRVNGFGNFHYVLIVKAEDGMFYCMDPLKDGLVPLSQYGNRVYAIRCVGR